MSQETITLPVHTCQHCGHKWIGKKTDSLPIRCAHCRTPNWNRPRVYRKDQ